jgi:hypothetical protein
MAKIAYVEPTNLRAGTRRVIEQANDICREFTAQGFVLTLRQLYYQFVARGLLANRQTEYSRLGGILTDARLMGLLDWNYLEDRTRNLRKQPSWGSPAAIIDAAARSYHRDLWEGQEYRVECWIEKDALVGVIEGVCDELDVPYFSCRGYTSISELHVAALRLRGYARRGQTPVILHLGDHDPSGIHMTTDILGRLATFLADVEVKRLALNWDQIERFQPPPNPVKLTDSRAAGYVARFGEESWELDALDPTTLADLIRDAVDDVLDRDLFEEVRADQEKEREGLTVAAAHWGDVASFLNERTDDGLDAR